MVKRSKFTVQVRISPAAIKEIEALVDAGEYSSRSDFVNQAVISELVEKRLEKELKERVLNLIKFDQEIRDTIRSI